MPRAQDADITDEDVARVLGLLAGTDIEELEVELGRSRLYIRRSALARRVLDAREQPAIPSKDGEVLPLTVRVTASLVGIYHMVATPDGKLGVEKGDEVIAGQVLGVIEAMGMNNPVEAPKAGVVEEVLVADGQPVEYGQTIMVLRIPTPG